MRFEWKNQTVRALTVFVVVLIGSGLLVYALLRTTTSQPEQTRTVAAPSSAAPPATIAPESKEPQQRSGGDNDSIFGKLFESKGTEATHASEGLGLTILRIILRLLLAASLGAALAYRPRKQAFALRRNPYVAQTQILLAIVASALMMIVGDNAARAFGIFAAVSLVRFRTNIRDPKEISVLLISLAIGLATGVGRPELALILCLFALAALWVLEHAEARQVFRSMELKVVTKDIGSTEEALKGVLAKHQFASEIRSLTRDGDERAGTIVEAVDISPDESTDKLSEEILDQDNNNITSIEWEQKKSFSYIYQ